MIKVRFYSKLLQKEVEKSFQNTADAFDFARKTNGIVIC